MLNAHCAKVVLGAIDIVGRKKLHCAYLNALALKEGRKLVFQMRNKICSTTMSRTKLK